MKQSNSYKYRRYNNHLKTNNMDDKFLTSKQLAEKLQVTEQTLKNWRDQQKIEAYKVGRVVRFKQSDVDRIFSKTENKKNGQ